MADVRNFHSKRGVFGMTENKKTHIAIIDSGISSKHNFRESIVGGVSVCIDENGDVIYLEDDYEDTIGHGTAVIDAILKVCSNVVFTCIKIFHSELSASMETLIASLQYIKNYVNCDIIHISAGVTYIDDYPFLLEKLDYFSQNNITIVSAFDNNGAISYPAACPQVIGVDGDEKLKNIKEYYITENGVIDIIVADYFHRLKWVSPTEIIIKGISFSCCYVTGMIANIVYKKQKRYSKEDMLYALRHSKYAKFLPNKNINNDTKNWTDGFLFTKQIKKAIVFPFNKEIHPLAIFASELPFEIKGFYDIRQHGKVGKNINDMITFMKTYDFIIENVDNINWEDDFDTVICGHCSEIERMTGKDYLKEILDNAKKYEKKVYSFDYIEESKAFFCPHIDAKDIPIMRRGRLRNRNTPIVGIFGTSSSQGKFTLQLNLKKKFIRDGYDVAQISTEPNGYLFGANGVYPMGYNCAVDVYNEDAVAVINEMIWDATNKDTADIMIVGGQSGTVIYDYSNLMQYNFAQYALLCGTTPDVLVVCINPHDDIEYIKRTISYLSSFGNNTIVGLVLFPVELCSTQLGYGITKKQLSKEKIEECTKKISESMGLPVFLSGNKEDLEKLYQLIIDAIS